MSNQFKGPCLQCEADHALKGSSVPCRDEYGKLVAVKLKEFQLARNEIAQNKVEKAQVQEQIKKELKKLRDLMEEEALSDRAQNFITDYQLVSQRDEVEAKTEKLELELLRLESEDVVLNAEAIGKLTNKLVEIEETWNDLQEQIGESAILANPEVKNLGAVLRSLEAEEQFFSFGVKCLRERLEDLDSFQLFSQYKCPLLEEALGGADLKSSTTEKLGLGRALEVLSSDEFDGDIFKEFRAQAEAALDLLPDPEDLKVLLRYAHRAVDMSQHIGGAPASDLLKEFRFQVFARYLRCDNPAMIAKFYGVSTHCVARQLDNVTNRLQDAFSEDFGSKAGSAAHFIRNRVQDKASEVFKLPKRVSENVIYRSGERYKYLILHLRLLHNTPSNLLGQKLKAALSESDISQYDRELNILKYVVGELSVKQGRVTTGRSNKLTKDASLAKALIDREKNDPDGFSDEIMRLVREYEFSLYCRNKELVTTVYGYRERARKGGNRRELDYKTFKSCWLGALNDNK